MNTCAMKSHINIAGGIGGASAAYFVRQLCGSDVGIHVFESQHVGGRLESMSFEGSEYELGGSMVYEDNIYIRCCGACIAI
jgi:protoporphyrinogen oxidase